MYFSHHVRVDPVRAHEHDRMYPRSSGGCRARRCAFTSVYSRRVSCSRLSSCSVPARYPSLVPETHSPINFPRSHAGRCQVTLTSSSSCSSRSRARHSASTRGRQIEQLLRCEPEEQVKRLCIKAREILIEEANMRVADSPVTVCASSTCVLGRTR